MRVLCVRVQRTEPEAKSKAKAVDSKRATLCPVHLTPFCTLKTSHKVKWSLCCHVNLSSPSSSKQTLCTESTNSVCKHSHSFPLLFFFWVTACFSQKEILILLHLSTNNWWGTRIFRQREKSWVSSTFLPRFLYPCVKSAERAKLHDWVLQIILEP